MWPRRAPPSGTMWTPSDLPPRTSGGAARSASSVRYPNSSPRPIRTVPSPARATVPSNHTRVRTPDWLPATPSYPTRSTSIPSGTGVRPRSGDISGCADWITIPSTRGTSNASDATSAHHVWPANGGTPPASTRTCTATGRSTCTGTPNATVCPRSTSTWDSGAGRCSRPR